MKKILLITFLSFAFVSYSQITVYHMVYVKSADQAKFESVEKNYMSKMAQTAVNDGQFAYWALEKFLHPMVPVGGKLNHPLVGNWYQFITVFPSLSAYVNSGPWWAGAGENLGFLKNYSPIRQNKVGCMSGLLKILSSEVRLLSLVSIILDSLKKLESF